MLRSKKKSLQIPRFRARVSLSERAVGRGPSKTCRSRASDELPEFRIRYRCSNFSRCHALLGGWSGRNSLLFPDVFHTRLGQRAGSEAQAPGFGLAEGMREPRRDLRLELRQLERPR